MIEKVFRLKKYYFEGNTVEVISHGYKNNILKNWFPELVKYKILNTCEIKTCLKKNFKDNAEVV